LSGQHTHPFCGISQAQPGSVIESADGSARITFGGRTLKIPKERGQIGTSDPAMASDGTVGWLVKYRFAEAEYAGTLTNHLARRQDK
jgi:hypothetical protein